MSRGRRIAYIVAALIAAIIIVAPPLYTRLFPLPTRYLSDEEHFKYGSVGVEPVAGVPFEVWRALPGVCMSAEKKALGYRQFGFQWEAGHAAPIGMPIETAIVPRVGVNCALCHVGRVTGPGGATRLLVGAPNATLDLQAYLRFLFSCASGAQYRAGPILDEIARQGGDLNLAQRLFYRLVIIPQTKAAILRQQRDFAFTDAQPDWGPGRVDGFNPAKIQVLKRPYDGTLDVVDMPPLWALGRRAGGAWHWDGLQTSLHEVFLNSGIGNGASARTIDLPSLDRMERWTTSLPPTPYPFAIDHALAGAGHAVFQRACADCHAPGGGKTGQVIPIGWVRTDRNRLDSWTPDALEAFRAIDDYPWRYTHFRKTGGYVAAPLDGIWARAPYLHNGSVPTLSALLSPAERRPVEFGRGSAAYDTARVGFASDRGKRFDTRLPGNGNGGHPYGADLPSTDKAALIEYLKTL
ncbi:cytochrome c [Sphingomonas profundi]|uniref:c-type cytochrome n=1 Tax=Alterirhizorhabdus profundi TaxID=2681549 RepID=UPI0012E8A44D|nr:cytochrome c [Sphingomonas profundi]